MPALRIASVPAEAAEWILRRKPGCFALGGENLRVPVLLATASPVGRAGFSLQLGGGGAGAHQVDHTAAGMWYGGRTSPSKVLPLVCQLPTQNPS